MLEAFLSKISTPVREDTLSGGRGVWERDVFPDFTIFEANEIPLKVSGIACDLVENDDLASVVERQVARDRQTDTFRLNEKTRTSLKRFAREYRLIRENGMDGLIRAAVKDGAAFNFYAKGVSRAISDNPVASWIHDRNEIAFRILNYQPGYNMGAEHNTLAHELGHCIMDDRNNRFGKAFQDLIATSDYGQFWGQFVQAQGFFYDLKHWEKVFQHYEKRTGKKPTGMTEAAQYIVKTVDKVQNLYDPDIRSSELFCRLLGHVGISSKGVEIWEDDHPHKTAVQTLIRLAEAYANGNPDLYRNLIRTVRDYKIPEAAYRDGMAFQTFQTQCLKKMTQSKVQESLSEQMRLYLHLRQLYFPFQDNVIKAGQDLMQQINTVIDSHPTQKQEQAAVQQVMKQHQQTKSELQTDMTLWVKRACKRMNERKPKRTDKTTPFYPPVKTGR